MQPQKTVADIWNEVREEQKRFNKALRYLFSALIVAFLIAAGAAYLSWTSLSEVSQEIQDKINNVTAESEITASETKRRNETMLVETLKLREEAIEQRESATLARDIDRSMSAYGQQRQHNSINELAAKAQQLSEAAAMGKRLNSSTAYVVETFRSDSPTNPGNEPSALLPEDIRRLINVVHLDWLKPDQDETEDAWERLTIESQTDRAKGLALAGLGNFHYRRAQQGQNSLDWESGCKDAVNRIRQAIKLGVESDLLRLAEGECLRKNGFKDEALDAFIEALKLQSNESALSFDQRRRAAHGAGTTLIAVQAAAIRSAAMRERLGASVEQLRSLKPETLGDSPAGERCPKSAAPDREALRDACLLLEYAAELRGKRGESEIGKIYTRENIGFIYLLAEDWPRAIGHAKKIDDELAAAWNLTILIIAMQEQAKIETNTETKKALEQEIARAMTKISLLEAHSLDEKEIKKLLDDRHADTVDEIHESMRGYRNAEVRE